MLDYNNCILTSKAYKFVELDTSSSRLSHAYMFVCEDENYLKAFVEKVCKLFINLNETQNASKNEMRIEKRLHPDVKFFGEDKPINAETANDIVEQSSYTPFEADKKIFVIFNAGEMNEASQNKILKTIEEPPANTYFILACLNTSRILQTIHSRVKKIELDKLSIEVLCGLLVQKGIDNQKAQIFASCANGNGTFAEKLATNEGFVEFFNQVVACFFEINGSRDVLKFSNIFNAKNIDKNEFFDIALIVLHDIQMILAKKQELVSIKNMIPKLSVISAMVNLDAVSQLVDTIIFSKQKLHFNVNSTAVVDEFLFKLAEVKVKCRRL